MAITFNCGNCGKSLTTSDDKAGRMAKCPGCGESVVVPPPTSESVPQADVPADEFGIAPPKRAESKINCPMCGKSVPASASECQFCGEPLAGADRPPPRRGGKGGHAIIDIGDVISTGWRVFSAEMGTSIGIFLVAALLYFAISLPQNVCSELGQQMMKNGDRQAGRMFMAMSLLFLLLSIAGQCYLTCGLSLGYLKLARGEPAQISDLFTGGRFFWRYLGASIVFGLMYVLGLLLCIIPGIIVLLMFAPYPYVLVDEDLPGIDCLWRARAVTEGNKLSCFVIGLACMGIYILGILACCVGLIFALPLCLMIFSVAYCKMTDQRTAK